MKTNQYLLGKSMVACMFMLLLSSCASDDSNKKFDDLQANYDKLVTEHTKITDELAIRNLAERFSDAANRKDGDAFQALWAKEGKWIIGAPINMEFAGKENMGSSVTHMLGLWDFFVQLSGPGVVILQGDSAKARFYVNEVARGKDGKGNYNLSMYEDSLVKIDGQWYYKKRVYHTIYQDAPVYKGLVQSLKLE
jgi:SnoaL-like domain